MILQDWFSLALICFFGALSPGPSLLVILAVTAAQGRRAGLLISFGHGLGVLFYAFLSATGLSLLIVSYENLFVFVQILGAIFLIWLGLNLIRSGLYNAKVYVIYKKFIKILAQCLMIQLSKHHLLILCNNLFLHAVCRDAF